jgi:glycosyltransferase involved in cell wall biosynthesis
MSEQAPVKLAIIANSMPPYRVHLHRRVAREMPEVRLYSVLTHEEDGRWALSTPPELNVVRFGPGESCWDQSKLRRSPHEWRKAARMIRWFGEEGISAAIVHGYNDVGRVRLLRWCKRHGVPAFVSGDSNIRDDDQTRGWRSFVKRRLLGRVLRLAAGVMPFGTRGREYFEKYGVARERIFYFPMEPDYELIESLPAAEVAEVAAGYGLAAGRRRLLFSGRLEGMKRVDLLIDAFASLAAERPAWDLVLMGDGELRAELERRVPAELAGRVRFLGHAADSRTVAAVCRACDVLVLPSEQERWALVINEGVAAGLAIVSSDVPGAVADLVRDGVNGRIFPRNDYEALRRCLLDVTGEDAVDRMKRASAGVLADWRREGDPIEGLRRALRSATVL